MKYIRLTLLPSAYDMYFHYVNKRNFNFLATLVLQPACTSIADVGFLLDSSGSLRSDYQKEKQFLKAIASTFGISSKGSRAGVVAFSSDAELSIRLNDNKNLTNFNAAVDKIPIMGSTTRIDKALLLAKNELFAIRNGARPGIPKILILLTDGSQTQDVDIMNPKGLADNLRKKGIQVLVVGIGSEVNEAELLDLGGNKAENVFSAASFNELISGPFIEGVTKLSCDIGKTIVSPRWIELP